MVALDQFTIRDTFTDDDGTTLENHDSDVNFSGNPWNNQLINGGTLTIQSNQIKLAGTEFGLPYTLYTKDAGSENYIIRLRMAGGRTEPTYFWFRVAADDTAYGMQSNHDGAGSYLRIVYFDGTSLTQLAEVNPGSLTDDGFHWYQIHVAGPQVRAFVEGFGPTVKTTMTFNLNETLIGLGGQRASQIVDEIQVIPLSPGVPGTDLATRLSLLEEVVDTLLTSVPAAITSLKDDIGVATVEAIDADPPAVDLVANAISAVSSAASTETASSISSIAAARVVIPTNALSIPPVRTEVSRLRVLRRSSFTHTLENVGDLAGVSKIVFTIKDNKEIDNDAASLAQVVLSIPAASSTDGIKYLGGSAAGAKRTSGSIAVQSYTEGSESRKRIVVAIADDATASIPVESNGTFDIKLIMASDSEIVDSGKAVVEEVTTWETSS